METRTRRLMMYFKLLNFERGTSSSFFKATERVLFGAN